MRQIHASYTDQTVTVYQAYPAAIAEPAVRAGTFVPPFRAERMTWIKPSFLWMMYRSGWATKPNQERVLEIQIGRDDLSWALSQACLSAFDRRLHDDERAWRAALAASPVRIQWDPDRDLHLRPTERRAIQIGLGPEASRRYVAGWIQRIRDVTPLAHQIRSLVRVGALTDAQALLPDERALALPPELAARLGAR
ncbi:DUF4291 domain-containing protein [Frankia sp. CNm7]|uniref:DUF4291 domain-containing protein n=1 Tax=Frankia nepalensis TaxID=1836974 RepID=A0A937URJ2_9ACTN|nr:DUF4291 domain-containing protein [Frankia nepalensis]MBL7497987.1 DUF4291 domain-containing protein [Frankia nepalensis]MBL7509068.1 DUF4291 domain-containing protein [Frankia nepalensis]MBL7516829.1 DUF4291 domain-containing protein [Frankia nepalensis]MBL7627826.1 DUF4291 domain-containing protein [Frankia nepalensis]